MGGRFASPAVFNEHLCNNVDELVTFDLYTVEQAMMIEERVHIRAPREAVFACYTQVDRWHEWDPDTAQARIDGSFRTGTAGRLKPAKGLAVPMLFSSVMPNRSFTVLSKVPLGMMRFDHELIPEGTGTTAVHRLTFSGPLGRLYYWMVGRQVRKGLPVTMHRLKDHVESGRSQTAA